MVDRHGSWCDVYIVRGVCTYLLCPEAWRQERQNPPPSNSRLVDVKIWSEGSQLSTRQLPGLVEETFPSLTPREHDYPYSCSD